MSCVPPGKVIATVTSLPAALRLANTSLSGEESSPTPTSLYSCDTEMAWLSRLSRATIESRSGGMGQRDKGELGARYFRARALSKRARGEKLPGGKQRGGRRSTGLEEVSA